MLLIHWLIPSTGRGHQLLHAALVAVGDVGELQLDVVGIGEEDTVIESRKLYWKGGVFVWLATHRSTFCVSHTFFFLLSARRSVHPNPPPLVTLFLSCNEAKHEK